MGFSVPVCVLRHSIIIGSFEVCRLSTFYSSSLTLHGDRDLVSIHIGLFPQPQPLYLSPVSTLLSGLSDGFARRHGSSSTALRFVVASFALILRRTLCCLLEHAVG